MVSQEGRAPPQTGPSPTLAGAAPSGPSSADGGRRDQLPRIPSQEGRARPVPGLLPHTHPCLGAGPRENEAQNPGRGATPSSLAPQTLPLQHRRPCSPLRRGVLAAQRVPKLHGGPAAFAEGPPALAGVVLQQLRQRSELLPAI